MVLTIFTIFGGFIHYSKVNNPILTDFIGKFREGKKKILEVQYSPHELGLSYKYLQPVFLVSDLP